MDGFRNHYWTLSNPYVDIERRNALYRSQRRPDSAGIIYGFTVGDTASNFVEQSAFRR